MCRVSTSSSAGPSRVSRPRRSSASTSNGSTASSTGTADGARTGISSVLMSGDGEVMALYLGSAGENRKGGGKSVGSSPSPGGGGATGLGDAKHRPERAGWGDGLSPRTLPGLRDHPTPSLISLRSM